VSEPLIAAIQRRVEQMENEVTHLRGEVNGARAALQGTWGQPGLIQQVRSMEARQTEMTSILAAVKSSQQAEQDRQADRDAARAREQEARDRRTGLYVKALLTLVVTVLAGVIVNVLVAGAHP
jgi:uncharacterized membrane protein